MVRSELIPKIGKRIKDVRLQKGLKLFQITEKCNISKGLLSKIENGRAIPSLPVCCEIIKALDVKLDDFFRDIEDNHLGTYQLIKKGEETPIKKEEATGFDYKKIIGVDLCDHNLNFVILDVEPKADRELVSTDGFEYIYMLSGDIEYILGKEKLNISEGDSLFFDGRIPHVPRNYSGKPAKLLVIYMVN